MRLRIYLFISAIVVLLLLKETLRYVRQRQYISYKFDGFNNETGTFFHIVPNLIHFIRFNTSNFTFVDIVVIRAAHLAQKPEAIYIHTNVKHFSGKYWLQLQRKWPDTYQLIQIKWRQPPVGIYDRLLNSSYRLHHGSDIERLRLLMEYGGIYLDNDVFVIRNLNYYRKFEMSLEWNYGASLGNQVFIAHKDARFLRLCLDTYRDYRSDLWYYNGGELPTKKVLHKHPEVIHRVTTKFGSNTDLSTYLYTENWDKWKEFDTIHLLTNHRQYMFEENYRQYPEFNESMILHYNFTFGEMARKIYFG